MKDCLQYAKENGTGSKSESTASASKKGDEAKTPSPKDMGLDAMLKEISPKAKGSYPTRHLDYPPYRV